MNGVPPGDDPDVNDIGHISGRDIELIKQQQDGTKITIERVGRAMPQLQRRLPSSAMDCPERAPLADMTVRMLPA